MDNKNRVRLQHHQQDIVKDLDITYIIDELFMKKVITDENLEYISNLVRYMFCFQTTFTVSRVDVCKI